GRHRIMLRGSPRLPGPTDQGEAPRHVVGWSHGEREHGCATGRLELDRDILREGGCEVVTSHRGRDTRSGCAVDGGLPRRARAHEERRVSGQPATADL